LISNKKIKKQIIACEGSGEQGTGHPKIYLTFGNSGEISCPYCGRKFNYQNKKKRVILRTFFG